MVRRTLLVLTLTCTLVATACPIAWATLGIGTTTPRIVIDQPVYPGGVYRLPPIPVTNTGTQRAQVRLFPDRASKQDELFADPGWFRVSHDSQSLEASTSALFDTTLTLPLTAAPGKYQVLLVGQPSVPGAEGSTPNIQVGTKVVFRVAPSNWFAALLWRLCSLLLLWAPWSFIVIALLLAAWPAWWVFRRYRFSFGVERRR